jgi:FHS family L-fucose permease-like MFS transporter
MAIMGGAILPKLMGYMADRTDLSRSFLVPSVCFAFIAWYAMRWSKFSLTVAVPTSGIRKSPL